MGYTCFGQIVQFRGPEHMDCAYALVRVLLKGRNMLYGEVGLGIVRVWASLCDDWKTLSVHQVVNGFLFRIREE